MVLPYGRRTIAEAVVAAHQLAMRPFTEGILGNQALVLFDGPVEVPLAGLEAGQGFDGIEAPFSEPLALQYTPVVVHALKVLVPVEAQRLVQQCDLLLRIGCPFGLIQQLLKGLDVVPVVGVPVKAVQAILKEHALAKDGPPQAVERRAKDAVQPVWGMFRPENRPHLFLAQALGVLEQAEEQVTALRSGPLYPLPCQFDPGLAQATDLEGLLALYLYGWLRARRQPYLLGPDPLQELGQDVSAEPLFLCVAVQPREFEALDHHELVKSQFFPQLQHRPEIGQGVLSLPGQEGNLGAMQAGYGQVAPEPAGLEAVDGLVQVSPRRRQVLQLAGQDAERDVAQAGFVAGAMLLGQVHRL